MKKYVFETIYEVVEEMVVKGENYKDAEENYREGEGDVIKERKHLVEWDCIKMPENLKEEMSDDNFIQFQDDFYNLLEKYGVKNITCEHEEWQEICKLRNKVVEFIEQGGNK